MRLGAKSVLLMAGVYGILIAAFAVGIDRWLRSFESEVALQASGLLARETAAMLSERTYGALQAPDAKALALLRERVQDLSLLSQIASSISVVDALGRVIASDRWPVGQELTKPGAVFADGWTVHPRLSGTPRFLRGGEHVVDVPMVDHGALVGYIEVEFHSEKVEALFGSARRRLLEAALAGLVGVVLLGGFLQFQISRRTAAIADTLEHAMEGTPQPSPDFLPPHAFAREGEFARVLEAAGRVQRVISDARRETSRLEESFTALAKAFQMGVLLLRENRDPGFANARALELLGVPSLAALQAGWPDLWMPLTRMLATLGQPGAVGSGDVEISVGRKLRVEPYRLGGEDCDEFLVLLNDLDVLDTLETDIRLANQLQGMARVYRTVAHELRAPLSAMMIHLDLLRESLTAEGATTADKETQDRYVGVLRGELERLNRALSEALTQTLPSPDQRDKFDLREALVELGTLLAPQARRQGVELRTAMPDEAIFIVGHRDRLKQSFLNIAVNALEAMPKGGRMSLEMQVEGSRVKVGIVDTGKGIPSDVLARIYERDFTTKGTGSGIGLYVARTLVEMHGGAIETESHEGQGTRVEVVLPILLRS
jgi:signal transduction histidine kinase